MAQYYFFWTCPECVHAQDVDLFQMRNTCRLIDEGASPIDGKVWEYADHDRCPVFQAKAEVKKVSRETECIPTLTV